MKIKFAAGTAIDATHATPNSAAIPLGPIAFSVSTRLSAHTATRASTTVADDNTKGLILLSTLDSKRLY